MAAMSAGRRRARPSGTGPALAEQRRMYAGTSRELEGPVVPPCAPRHGSSCRSRTPRRPCPELHHRPHVRGHRRLRGLGEPPVGSAGSATRTEPTGGQRVVGGGLVGDDVDRRPREQGREHLGGAAEDPIERATVVAGPTASSRAWRASRPDVEVAVSIRGDPAGSHSMQIPRRRSWSQPAAGRRPCRRPAVSVMVPAVCRRTTCRPPRRRSRRCLRMPPGADVDPRPSGHLATCQPQARAA